jgi:glycosyltransferase involved in cell wall biosynthesis
MHSSEPGLKFVLLTQYYPPEVGGAQVLMSSLATELQRQGCDMRVVTALPNYPTGKIFGGYRNRLFVRESREGIPLFRTWVYAAQSARMLPRLTSYLSFCLSSFLATFWMDKPDVIFVDSPPLFLGVTALIMARLKGSKLILNISDLWPDAVADLGMVRSNFLLRLASRLEVFLYRHADYVCTVTEGISEILHKEKNVPGYKLQFMPIGVDTRLFQPRIPDKALLEQYKLQDKSVFIYAGTMGHAQGLTLLLQAAEALRERQDIVLVFIGDGPVKVELEAQKAQLGLSRIFFVDPIPLGEMPRWWSLARGALVPLKDQTIHISARPSKAFPPLASGVPVIFSGRGEMARILSQAQAGIVVAPEQLQPLVASILKLTDDPVLARKLGENGRQLCEQEFSWNRIVQKWLEALMMQQTKKGALERVLSVSSS